MQRTRWPAIALLALVTLPAACDSEDSPPANPLTPVRVAAVATQNTSQAVRYTANITAKSQVNVSFQVSGTIQEIQQRPGADGQSRNVQQGDLITKDSVLAKVDDSQYKDQVKQAQSQVGVAEAALSKGEQDYRRASDLYAKQSMTATEYDQAKKEYQTAVADVSGAKAQLSEAKLNLQYTSLKAPVAGVLLQRNVEVGTLVSPGTVGFVIANVSSVKAVFGIPGSALQDVKIGNPMTITTESIPGKKFDGTITAIAPSADTSTRVFEVEVTVPNPDSELKDGMIASLSLAEGPQSAPAAVVPLDAIVRSQDDPKGYAVFILEKKDGAEIARRRDVQVGQVYGNRIAVTSGVEPGEQVIVTGTNIVNDGDKVRVIP